MKFFMPVLLALSFSLPSFFLADFARAETPEQTGLAVAKETNRRDNGWGDFSAQMTMLLKNRQGEESKRTIRIQNLEVPGDGDKSLSIFDHPADIKGTALLTYSHKTGDDDQWLYLPALKRVKRIASSNKSGSFMGSEFAFEDIVSQEIEKYAYKHLREETLDGQACFVQARFPTDKNSGYTRQVAWIDKTHYRILKMDYFDRKNELLKTLSFRGYKQYLNQFWRADEMFMENHQSGKSTLLKWGNYRFRTGLKNNDFDQASLQRAH